MYICEYLCDRKKVYYAKTTGSLWIELKMISKKQHKYTRMYVINVRMKTYSNLNTFIFFYLFLFVLARLLHTHMTWIKNYASIRVSKNNSERGRKKGERNRFIKLSKKNVKVKVHILCSYDRNKSWANWVAFFRLFHFHFDCLPFTHRSHKHTFGLGKGFSYSNYTKCPTFIHRYHCHPYQYESFILVSFFFLLSNWLNKSR